MAVYQPPVLAKNEESPLKSVPSLMNFFVYNSTFGPKEGQVKSRLSVCLSLSVCLPACLSVCKKISRLSCGVNEECRLFDRDIHISVH